MCPSVLSSRASALFNSNQSQRANTPGLCAAQHHFFPTPSPMSRKGMPTRPHPRAERRLKPDEWRSGTACSPGPYFTPPSLIKTRRGARWAKAAYSGSEKDIGLQRYSGRGADGARVTAEVSDWLKLRLQSFRAEPHFFRSNESTEII